MKVMKLIISPLLQPIFAVVLGLLIGAIAILFVGGSIVETYQEMWKGAFGNLYFVTATLARATPILLVALGVGYAFRAGVFNLGAEGQMVLGAVFAALTAIYVPGSGIVKLLAAIVVGIMAGGLWSLLAGWMETKFKIQLIISTLLLNYIAILFASYLVSEPFQDTSGSAALAQTVMLDQSAWIPKLLPGMSLHGGFIAAIVIALILSVVFRYTKLGYEVNMLGLNSFFARYGGIKQKKLLFISMITSGGLAGIAGAFEVLGSQYRFVDGALTIPGYAWTGLMAALLAKSNPIGTIVASILLAALQTGAMGVERNTDVPLEISSIVQAVLILFISAKISLNFLNRKKKGSEANGTV